jgi:transposase
MDVHKESIDVAIADAKEARHYGRIGGDAASVDRLIRKLRTAHRGERRVERFEQAIVAQLEHWRWREAVQELQALRGISRLHAARIIAELGDFQRFDTPRKLIGYLGMIPSEDSSGPRRRQGAITKAGNSSARRALIEAAQA